MSPPIPDPLSSPLVFELGPDGGPDVFFSARCTGPMEIQGSTVGPPCAWCGTRLWVAPSSRLTLGGRLRDGHPSLVPFCFGCMGHAGDYIRARGGKR